MVVLTLDRDVGGIEPGRLPHAETIDGVSVRRMGGFGSKRSAIGVRPDLVVRAARWADVVHVHDLRFLFGTTILGALAARTPLIFHTHGLLFHTPRTARLKRLAMRRVLRPAAVPVARLDRRRLAERRRHPAPAAAVPA